MHGSGYAEYGLTACLRTANIITKFYNIVFTDWQWSNDNVYAARILWAHSWLCRARGHTGMYSIWLSIY